MAEELLHNISLGRFDWKTRLNKIELLEYGWDDDCAEPVHKVALLRGREIINAVLEFNAEIFKYTEVGAVECGSLDVCWPLIGIFCVFDDLQADIYYHPSKITHSIPYTDTFKDDFLHVLLHYVKGG